jgi:hypothetical protein
VSSDINNIWEQEKKGRKNMVINFVRTSKIHWEAAVIIKKSWTTVDDLKTDQKERMKANC